jgi:hypothetical protein
MNTRVLLFAGILLAVAGGVTLLAIFGRGGDEPVPDMLRSKEEFEQLIARREHVTLVLSGRLMAEFFPCG